MNCPICSKPLVKKTVHQKEDGSVMPSGFSRLSYRFKFKDKTVMYFHEANTEDCYQKPDWTTVEGVLIKGKTFQI